MISCSFYSYLPTIECIQTGFLYTIPPCCTQSLRPPEILAAKTADCIPCVGEIGTGIQNGSKQNRVRWIGNIGKKIGKIGIADKSGLLDKYDNLPRMMRIFN